MTEPSGSGGIDYDPYLFMLLLATFGDGNDTPADQASFSLTVNIGGQVVSGTAISHAAWVQEWVGQVSEASATMGETLSVVLGQFSTDDAKALEESKASGTPLPAPQYVHLRNARFVLGGVTIQTGLWRGRLDRVDGWSLSSVNT